MKISGILKSRGLFSNDIKIRFKNKQILLDNKVLMSDIDLPLNNMDNVYDVGDFIFNKISNNKIWSLRCVLFGFDTLFDIDRNFNDDLTDFLSDYHLLKISKKDSLILKKEYL